VLTWVLKEVKRLICEEVIVKKEDKLFREAG